MIAGFAELLASQPILSLFLAVAVGYAVGQINIAGFSLGIGAVLLVGLAIGGIAPKAQIAGPIGLIGLTMFLYGIGILYGRQFFEGLTGQGKTYNFTPATGTFSVSHTANDNDLLFSYQSPGLTEWWYLEFMAPQGATLVPGTYNNAGRAGFQPATQPGLDVNGDGRGSNTLTGSFIVSAMRFAGSSSTRPLISFSNDMMRLSLARTYALRLTTAGRRLRSGLSALRIQSRDQQNRSVVATGP